MKPETVTVTVRKRDLLALGRVIEAAVWAEDPPWLLISDIYRRWNKIAVQAGIADPEPPPSLRDGKETGGDGPQ